MGQAAKPLGSANRFGNGLVQAFDAVALVSDDADPPPGDDEPTDPEPEDPPPGRGNGRGNGKE